MTTSPEIEELCDELTLALLFEKDATVTDAVVVQNTPTVKGAQRLKQRAQAGLIVSEVERFDGEQWRLVVRQTLNTRSGSIEEVHYD